MHYYSTQSFLAWVINTYFYNEKHYTYVAPFLPYRLPNPSTSNPHEIFSRLYKAWLDKDDYDPLIAQNRLGLRKGVMANKENDKLEEEDAARLKSICDRTSIKFFCPVVYRVDMAAIEGDRLVQEGSARRGSEEYLIPNLREDEFDVLFFDYVHHEVLGQLFERGEQNPESVFTTLETNYVDIE